MDYIITTYPMMYKRYLVQDVNSFDEAWDMYYSNDYDYDAMLVDEEFMGDDGDIEIELVTPKLKIQYGLGGE